MSLISIAKRVLRVAGWPEPSGIASSTDATARQVMGIANNELETLSEKLRWPQLQVEYTFNTIPGQSLYTWPEDFRIAEADAIFSATEYYRLRGSTQLQYWQLYKYGQLGSLSAKRHRLVYDTAGNPFIEITPTPSEIESLVAVYYTKNFAIDEDGNPIPEYSADEDVSRIPERLVRLGMDWRFRRAKGLDFSAELAEYNSEIATQFAQYNGFGEIAVGGRRIDEALGVTPGYVPDHGFGQ